MLESTSITLTRDELIVFLAIMGLSTMNGLGDEPLAGLSEREVEERMNSGEQSLLNRGLISFEGEDRLVLDDVLVALVGGSVVPDATFLLTETQPDGSVDPHYFNATPELLIEHYSPRAGIHVFNHLPSTETLVWRVQTLLAPLHPLPTSDIGPPQQMAASALSQSMEHARQGDEEAAKKALVEAGMPREMAATFAKDCGTHATWIGVVAWGLRQEEPEGGDSVMTVLGDGHCWLVENVEDHPEDVKISPASGEECEKAFTALLQPLKEALKSSD